MLFVICFVKDDIWKISEEKVFDMLDIVYIIVFLVFLILSFHLSCVKDSIELVSEDRRAAIIEERNKNKLNHDQGDFKLMSVLNVIWRLCCRHSD